MLTRMQRMLKALPTLEDLGDVAGKNVLVRTDYNVPLRESVINDVPVYEVADDFRISQSYETLDWLKERGANLTVCSHLGRPEGKYEKKYSLEPVEKILTKRYPDIKLLENLRFNPGEKACEESFIFELIRGQDYYVNDAFGVSHRAHASIVGPPRYLKSAAGRLLVREVSVISELFENPKRPLLCIIGGLKVSDKIGVLKSLSDVADQILIGGAMAFTFLKAAGHHVGSSIVELDQIDFCKKLMDKTTIHLPDDFLCAKNLDEESEIFQEIPAGRAGFDIGPHTAEMFCDLIAGAGTVFWNGPMGVFENPRFRGGTRSIAHCIAESKCYSLVGGGDSARAIKELNLTKEISYISTGGGACLELIEYHDLPGLRALREGIK
jgi:phosphoglycerate kinase